MPKKKTIKGRALLKSARPASHATKKPNPFERKVVRPKFSVMGRNLKSSEKFTGQSRQASNETARAFSFFLHPPL